MKRAVVISFNWLTREKLHTDFEGDKAANKAQGWVQAKWLWEDFPASDGWTHFAHWNKEASVDL